MATIRSYIFVDQLQPKTMCYLGTFARGFLPRRNMAAADVGHDRANCEIHDPARFLRARRARRARGRFNAEDAEAQGSQRRSLHLCDLRVKTSQRALSAPLPAAWYSSLRT